MRWIGEFSIFIAYFIRPRVTAESTPPETETLHITPNNYSKHGSLQSTLSHVVVEQSALVVDPLARIKRTLFLFLHWNNTDPTRYNSSAFLIPSLICNLVLLKDYGQKDENGVSAYP